jgi:hypothetical protein
MRSPHLKSFAVCLLAGISGGSAFAVDATEARGADHDLQPIYTHYAKTLEKVTFRSRFSAFNGVELQEADDFDGATVGGELVIPFAKRFQLMLAGPIYTWGEAHLIAPGHPKIDLWGWSGTFELPNAQLQWQFLTEEDDGFNMAVSAGYGVVLGKLHTTTADVNGTANSDIYNHGGSQILVGAKADRHLNDWLTLVGNFAISYYPMSDDLHPGGGGDSWVLGTFAAAGVFHPWAAKVYPTVELVYSTDFSGYNSVLVVPEVILPVCKNFEFKVGIPLGLTNDGERYGASVEGTFRF